MNFVLIIQASSFGNYLCSYENGQCFDWLYIEDITWPQQGIRILSSRAESISHSFASLTLERYFQRLKIKFVSPRGHVISSISSFHKKTLHFANRSRSKSTVLSAIYNEVQVGPNEFREFNVPNVNVRNTRKL